MIAVYILIGLVVGVVVTFLIMRLQVSKVAASGTLASTQLNQELQQLDKECEALRNNLKDMNNEKSGVISKVDSLESENRNLSIENAGLKTQLRLTENSIKNLKDDFNKEKQHLEEERLKSEENSEKLRKESDAQWQIKFDKLKEEFQNIASQLLSAKQASLQQNNKDQISELLKPIQLQFEAFRKSVEDSKTSNEVAKKELQDSFESTLKLFAHQQNQVVEALKQETVKIGNDAANLTNALTRDTKKQGNWGELILETLLESSGLEKDVHYFIQETVKDEDGNILRPDVIVKFPEGRSVIIDSKVSLTAYTESFRTEDEELKRKRLKDHARSVKKHVEELASKKYDDVVSDAIGFVLMFIPNDQCYLAALEEDPDLSRYAYNKGIVIISPSNLMMALQLAYNMWQQDVSNRSTEEIVKLATDLYEKVANFSESMESVAKHIHGLQEAFHKARSQMFKGNGNIMKRVESLKNYGVNPKKQIKGGDVS